MSWQLLILLQAFLVAISMIITRLLARDKKTARASFVVTAGWLVILYICGLAFLPWLGNVHLASLQHYWLRFIIGGTAFASTGIFTYKLLVYLDAAVGSILGSISTVFTVIGAAIFLHEDLSNLQIVGAGLLLLAITYGTLATRHKPSKQVHRNLLLGGAYAVAAGLTYAVAALNEKSLLSHISAGDYMAFGWAWQMLMAVFIALIIQPKEFRLLLRPAVAGWTFALGVLRATSGLCFILAQIRSNNVALVTVVSNFRLIVIIILGYWLLKERTRIVQKLVSASGAIAAMAIMLKG